MDLQKQKTSITKDSISPEEHFYHLAERIYLTPSDSVIQDCLFFIASSKDDLDLIRSIDVPSVSIHYSNSPIQSFYSEISDRNSVENSDLLGSLVSSYEFMNIKSEE